MCFAFHLCMYYVCIMCVPIRMYCYTLYCYNWLRCNHTSFPPTPCVGLRIFTLFFRPLRSVSYREKIVSSLCSVDLRMTFLFFSFFFFLRNKLNFDSYSRLETVYIHVVKNIEMAKIKREGEKKGSLGRNYRVSLKDPSSGRSRNERNISMIGRI